MFSIHSDKKDRAIVIYMEGALMSGNVPDAEKVWYGALSMDRDVIAMNCSRLSQIDSSAISRIIRFMDTTRQSGIKLVLYDINDSLKAFLTVSGINDYFEVLSHSEFELRYG